MELNKALVGIMVIGLTFLVLATMALMLGSFGSSIELLSNSSTQTILTSSTDTLTPIDDGITSSSANANNQTWLEFDGDGDYIRYVGQKFNYDNKTLSLWVNHSNIDSTTKYIIANIYSSSKGWRITSYGNDLYFKQTNSSGQQIELQSPGGLLSANTWQHLAITKDGSNVIIYIDGKFAANGTINGLTDSDFDLYTGAYPVDQGSEFNGSINNILLFDRPLNQFEISEIYDRGRNNYSIINSNISIERDYIDINSYWSSRWITSTAYNSTGTLYAFMNWGNAQNGTLVKTNDNFSTITQVENFSVSIDGGIETRTIFIDSSNTIFMDRSKSGYLWMSKGNDTNWTSPLTLECGENSSVWGITEDNNSYIYAGEYTVDDGDTSECANIYRSINGGDTWSIVYNDSITPATNRGGRHIHNVKFNPYNNCLYASVGDADDVSKLVKSCDAGSTWDIIYNDSSGRGNFIAMEFTENYRFFGEDQEYNTPNSQIQRTSDDINFEVVLTLEEPYDSNFWSSTQDNNGVLYFGTLAGQTTSNESMWSSSDEGDTWVMVDEFYTTGQWKGYLNFPEFFNGSSYIVTKARDGETYGSIYRFNSLFFNNPIISNNLNENSGTTAHDLSGNGNDGTISGATWNTDGLFVLLTEGVDYSIDTATGLFTILNTDYSWSEITASWNYGYESVARSITSSSETELGNQTSLLGMIITILLISVVLTILIGVFLGVTNKSKI